LISTDPTVSIDVRTATQQDRHQLANLTHFETYVHRHLDWRPPLDWLGHSPNLVAVRGDQVIGSLTCPPDPPEVGWIRLFVVAANWFVQEGWTILWEQAREELRAMGNIPAAAIPLQNWFQNLLVKSNFQQVDNVVSLVWSRGTILPEGRETGVRIRPMNFDDLATVEKVDSEAFGQLWRNTFDSLELAYKQQAVATVAEDDTGIIGYQISTANPMGGHLARLAVVPGQQGKGIGRELVRDVINQFDRRGALRLSVNTQEQNQISLALYRKMGFRQTGEVYPVFVYSFENP
jgi:ribosomal protein S18 acetylase RimI-like enzyme